MPSACISAVCYPSIEAAVDASVPGDTIRLEAGIHHAAAVIDHDLNLVRNNTDEVILRDGLDGEPILRVLDGATVTVINVALASSTGRVFDVEEGGNLNLNGDFLYSNAVVVRGGIGRVRGGTLTVMDSLFVGGQADVGGQLYVEDGHVEVSGTTFRDGFARSRGGAIAFVDTDEIVDEHVVNADFKNDYATNGGAIYVSRESLTLGQDPNSSASFDGCGAQESGGVLFAYGADVTMSNTSMVDTDVPFGAAIHLVSSNLVTSGGSFIANNLRIAGGSGTGIYTNHLTLVTLNEVMLLNLDARSATEGSPGVGVGVSARENAATTLTRSWFCGSRAPARPLFDGTFLSGGTLQIANNRFAYNAVAGAVITLGGTGGSARIAHNDFVANGAAPFSVPGSIDTVLFRANIITGHDVPGPLLDYAAPRLLVTDTNLFWDNGIAALTNLTDGVGFVGDPELKGYDPATACQFSAGTDGWAIPGAPFARYRSAGRDGDAQAEDPDGTPADLGAGGGPYAFDALWLDPDGDHWATVYDCPATEDLANAATVNPGVPEVPYNGVDQDCDGWYDYDADRDGHVSDKHGGDDCNDADAQVRPSAQEVGGNLIDENCDGSTDGDGDGFEPGTGPGADCNDLDATIFPGRSEDADTDDRNCDGVGDIEAPLTNVGCEHTSPASWPFSASFAGLLAVFARRRRDR